MCGLQTQLRVIKILALLQIAIKNRLHALFIENICTHILFNMLLPIVTLFLPRMITQKPGGMFTQ